MTLENGPVELKKGMECCRLVKIYIGVGKLYVQEIN